MGMGVHTHPQEGRMRRILALAILALTLAGGLMTFIASNEAQARDHGPHGSCEDHGRVLIWYASVTASLIAWHSSTAKFIAEFPF